MKIKIIQNNFDAFQASSLIIAFLSDWSYHKFLILFRFEMERYITTIKYGTVFHFYHVDKADVTFKVALPGNKE